jgi:hypothetical protein
MYRFPEYGHNVAVRKRKKDIELQEGRGHNAPTWAASTTLLCLKGLKSSLICTGGLFLIDRPKNGLGVAGACTYHDQGKTDQSQIQ